MASLDMSKEHDSVSRPIAHASGRRFDETEFFKKVSAFQVRHGAKIDWHIGRMVRRMFTSKPR